jgi:2-oxoglutarate dehydrogenase E1 component
MSEDLRPSPSSEHTELIEQNGWLVEEKYQQFLVNPSSVDESWRAMFADRQPRPPTERSAVAAPPVSLEAPRPTPTPTANGGPTTNGAAIAPGAPTTNGAPAQPAVTAPPAAPSTATTTSSPTAESAVLLRGAPGKLAENMIESLGVPTATSVHPLPAAVLEANRKLVNDHLATTTGKKISFTHLIAYAIVRGIAAVPVLNSSFVADANGAGTPGVIHHEHLGLGLAIDLERRDGGRSLVVAAIHDADLLGFVELVDAYDDLVRRARDGKLTAADFAGVTVSITNPGGLGTTQSVPRLMSGQGAIIGVGAIDYPVEFAATDRATLNALGIGKVLTLTSTYDHRIIQGAESGMYLKYVHELLIGEHGFYEDVFSSIGLSKPPVRLGRDQGASAPLGSAVVDARITSLVDAYRTRGHLAATLDPLGLTVPEHPADLDPTAFGFSVFDLDREFSTGGVFGKTSMRLSSLIERLRATYCDTVGAEFRHIQDPLERKYFEERLEREVTPRTPEEQLRTLDLLERAETFERFLQTRYVGLKRFSLEGGESTLAFLDTVLEEATANGVTEAILGMAHRGRLNTLANIVGKPLAKILAEFEDTIDPLTVEGAGDVKYHKGGQGTWTGLSGRTLRTTLSSNPSHLEAVNPVVEGMARARQDVIGAGGEAAVLPVLIHGDASMAGQGVVAETLNLSRIPAYRTGGTIHLVINNQIGFTTPWESGRSTRYASDVAKMIEAPVLHVNGDDPDAVARCAQIAVEYRTKFAKDVVVDLVCYRLHGHNEGDDPTYTQPVMYRAIAEHPSPRAVYAERLIGRGVTTADEVTATLTKVNEELASTLSMIRENPRVHLETLPEKPLTHVPSLSAPAGVDRAQLDAIVEFLLQTPEGFHIHPKLERQFSQRHDLYRGGEVDWAHGEALAYATVLLEGTSIRFIGQDARRGTFSHRNATLSDYDTAAEYTPLAALGEGVADGLSPASPAHFRIWDSALTEYAGLGFEYGYTLGDPASLVIWEAQFGDFANGGQIIFDNFIASSEEKWGQRSGVMMFLPHGYEGQGPEHSSARIERYLQASSGENFSVVQPTTAAQLFHLVRAQAHLAERRPVVVITPKSLLRSRLSRSKVDDLVDGAFHTVIDDAPSGSPDAVRRVVVCSGRLAEDLVLRRNVIEQEGGEPVAILRLEQLAPWPTADVAHALARYPRAESVVFAQDEPENMGPLTYVLPRLSGAVGAGVELSAISRQAAGSPATGSHDLHELERNSILDRAVGPAPS